MVVKYLITSPAKEQTMITMSFFFSLFKQYNYCNPPVGSFYGRIVKEMQFFCFDIQRLF